MDQGAERGGYPGDCVARVSPRLGGNQLVACPHRPSGCYSESAKPTPEHSIDNQADRVPRLDPSQCVLMDG
jgi:hypothetical protein